jgi:hypothetical protein
VHQQQLQQRQHVKQFHSLLIKFLLLNVVWLLQQLLRHLHLRLPMLQLKPMLLHHLLELLLIEQPKLELKPQFVPIQQQIIILQLQGL